MLTFLLQTEAAPAVAAVGFEAADAPAGVPGWAIISILVISLTLAWRPRKRRSSKGAPTQPQEVTIPPTLR